ncbi:MAG: tRNA (cytidine(56)-2'-O)-methyltransferase [Candidatus Nanoarchaeia archaeon]
MIELLRLGHRLPRDQRTTTHCGLAARALGATKMWYTGDRDQEMEEGLHNLTTRFGGSFTVEWTKDEYKLIQKKKKEGFTIIHLTMYGLDFEKTSVKAEKQLLVIGGEKVAPELYQMSDYNISIGNQPHSEVAALALYLYKNVGLKKKFDNAVMEIEPSERGKVMKRKE